MIYRGKSCGFIDRGVVAFAWRPIRSIVALLFGTGGPHPSDTLCFGQERKCISISLEAIFAEWWYKAKLSWERVKAEWKWHRNKSSLLCKSITWSFAPFCSLSSDNKVFYNFGFPLKTLRSTDEVKMISWKLANSSVKGECFGQICKR